MRQENAPNAAEYLEKTIRPLCGYLGINTEILVSSEIRKNMGLKGEAKVIDICEQLEGDCYINAIGGMSLYHRERFESRGI